jgi:hypothetical protein
MYNKTTWINATTLITPALLKKLETQYDEAVAELDTIVRLANTELLVQVAASAPAGADGKLYFDSTTGKFNYYNGSAFVEIGGG